MGIVYLDVDDEITSAASRMRTSAESRIVLVLPGGSRLGTSRINFRLLAREAATSGRTLSIVSPEAPTRALAASAGLPVYASVFEYEAALEAPGPEPGAAGAAGAAAGEPARGVAPAAASPGSAAAGTGPAGDAGVVSPGTAAAGAEAVPVVPAVGAVPGGANVPTVPRRHAGADGPPGVDGPAGPSRAGRSRPPAGVLVLLAILVFVAGAGAVLGYVLLPSATVSVVVRPKPLGPVDLTVTADPAAGAPDATTSVIPAERPTFDLRASGSFPATGKKVTETKATGSIRWQNCDPTSAYQVPSGTVVRTRGGVGFALDETVFLPVALLAGNPPAITCQTRDVGVTATTPGEAGNVGAGAIVVVPAAYNSVVVRVSNPAPTGGGTHTETKLVSQKDVDAATKTLTAKLDAQFRAILADPTQAAPGRLVFADTASRGAPVAEPDPATLVGQEVDGFDLALTATGSVTAVDEAAVKRVAETRLTGSVPAGEQLVEGSTRVDVGEPSVAGHAVRFPVTATAQVIRPVDPADVRRAVAGKTLESAREALATFGEATLAVWPGWVTTVPTLDFRLAVDVTTETGPGGSSPTGSPGTAPAGVGGGASSSVGGGAGSSSGAGAGSASPAASGAP